MGGGTPTFFSPQNLNWLITHLLEGVDIHPDYEFSFEGHPNNTTKEHLQTLFNLGFTRVSFGVQDLDAKVQHTINRIQPFENLERVTKLARELGYKSVSFDLIYGLPFQNPFTVSDTIDKVLLLRPDRLSFYSYATFLAEEGQRGTTMQIFPRIVERICIVGNTAKKSRIYDTAGSFACVAMPI